MERHGRIHTALSWLESSNDFSAQLNHKHVSDIVLLSLMAEVKLTFQAHQQIEETSMVVKRVLVLLLITSFIAAGIPNHKVGWAEEDFFHTGSGRHQDAEST